MKKIKNNLRNIALTSLFTLAGAFNYSGETIFNNNKDVSYSVVSSAPKDSLNIYKPLEIISKETVFPREFYLTPDSLNSAIRTAYDEMKNEGKRWPQEVDKRLFRLILRQESSYNVASPLSPRPRRS